MTRMLLFLLILTITSTIAMWFVENDGSLTVEWMGYYIQTTISFIALAGVMLFVALMLLMQGVFYIFASPARWRQHRVQRRRDQGLSALSKGLVALAAGDTKSARKLTKKVEATLGMLPVTRLLSAQTARLEGNRELAQQHYTAMLEDKETEIVAIKGLLVQAQEDGDTDKAVFLAEKALKASPGSDWPVAVLLELYQKTRQWEKLRQNMRQAVKLKILEPERVRRNMAVVALAQAREAQESGNEKKALLLAKEAFQARPALSAIALFYAECLQLSGDIRKAASVVEQVWKKQQTPDVMDFYAMLHAGMKPKRRLEKLEKLVSFAPDSALGHCAVAKLAMDQGLYEKARQHLKMALEVKDTRAVCQLMLELERREGASEDTLKHWEERLQHALEEPKWHCGHCGNLAPQWQTHCPHCHSFDSLEWGASSSQGEVLAPKVTGFLS